MFKARAASQPVRQLDSTQGGQKGWPKGYVSRLVGSLTPPDALLDMTNMDFTQIAHPTTRPPLTPYGSALVGTPMGFGRFTKLVGGRPQYYEISMQVIGGAGRLFIRKDGEAWELIEDGAPSPTEYDPEKWAFFCQSSNRVYVTNASNNLSYYDIYAETVTVYEGINAPTSLTATQTGLNSTSTYPLYYWVTAINGSGETTPTLATSSPLMVEKLRNEWDPATEYVDLSWSPVADATEYVVYLGTQPGAEKAHYMVRVAGVTFRDNGSLATTPLRRPPDGNSTAAPILTRLINKNGEMYGVGDVNNPSFLWKDGGPEAPGDFFAGYLGIDNGGETVPVDARPFRDGKGNSVITVLTRGPATAGKMFHVGYTLQTVGDETFALPEVYEANGQSGTVAPLGVIEIENSLQYPTGEDFKSNGSAENIPNILSTSSIAQWIEPDVRKLNLSAMEGCIGIAWQNRGYWAVPHISDHNNQIWIKDYTRGGIWIMPWIIAAKYMWLYEDNGGTTHFCLLVNDKVMEFDWEKRNPTQDDGVAFSTRVAGVDAPYSESGLGLAAVYKKRFKVLSPRGTLVTTITGEGKTAPIPPIPQVDIYPVGELNTGWDQFIWDEQTWDEDPGVLETQTQGIGTITVPVRKKLNDLGWEIRTTEPGSNYTLAAHHTEGIVIDNDYVRR